MGRGFGIGGGFADGGDFHFAGAAAEIEVGFGVVGVGVEDAEGLDGRRAEDPGPARREAPKEPWRATGTMGAAGAGGEEEALAEASDLPGRVREDSGKHEKGGAVGEEVLGVGKDVEVFDEHVAGEGA